MKVAVVGSGVSGLAATWLLNEHSDHEVHLYEADDRPGGHAHTVRFQSPSKKGVKDGVDVDTGFIVFNPSSYPNFLRFLGLYPSITIEPTEMTFSVSRDHGAFEWAGNNLRTVFCQPARLLDPDMWRLIYDLLRFNACARRLVADLPSLEKIDFSIGEYLDREGYSHSFRDNYLIPMTAAIWSTPPDKCAMDFPARTLIQFMHNHHLLQVTGKPSWLTIKGGSHNYVKAILAELPQSQLHLASPVKSLSTSVIRTNGSDNDDSHPKIQLTTESGQVEVFDHVILACHSDTAVSILKNGGDMTKEEEKILGAFQWNQNEVILHSDVRLMPKRKLAWSCWNYLTYSTVDEQGKKKANSEQISLYSTDGMNDLQHISEKQHGPVLVTLNPPFEPAPETIVGRYKYDHPVLDGEAVKNQHLIPKIQGTRSISYAGAYLNFGFHEDGFTSGLLAATRYAPSLPSGSVRMPFDIQFADGASWGGDAVGARQQSGGDRAVKVLAGLFDAFEGSGARVLVGWVLASVLEWVGWMLGLGGIRL